MRRATMLERRVRAAIAAIRAVPVGVSQVEPSQVDEVAQALVVAVDECERDLRARAPAGPFSLTS